MLQLAPAAPPRELPKPCWETLDGTSSLYLSDALDFMSSIPSGSVDCIWTDPPYLLSNGGPSCRGGVRVSVDKGDWDRSQGDMADHEFNRSWLAGAHRILKPAGSIWVTGTVHSYLSVGMAMAELGFRILNDIVWEKPNPPPNLGCRCFTHSTEVILWATKAPLGSGGRHVFHYDDMKDANGGTQMRNVWRFPPAGRIERRHGSHPTQKPVALIERCILASTDVGGLVVDPFLGSGSTGVAAMGVRRRFMGSDISEDYLGLSIRRLSGLLRDYSESQHSSRNASRSLLVQPV